MPKAEGDHFGLTWENVLSEVSKQRRVFCFVVCFGRESKLTVGIGTGEKNAVLSIKTESGADAQDGPVEKLRNNKKISLIKAREKQRFGCSLNRPKACWT